MKKTIFCVIMALALILSLASCNKSGDAPQIGLPKNSNSIFFPRTRALEKIPFVLRSVRLYGPCAERNSREIFSEFRKIQKNFPHVLLVGKSPSGLFRQSIIPFTVHNGSRLSGTPAKIAELEPDATVISDGFTVSMQNAANAAEDVAEWLQDLGF